MAETAFIETFLKSNLEYVRDKYADKTAITVTSKAHPSDLLTEVDLTVQKRFVERIDTTFPGDTIIGEEGEFRHVPEGITGRAWIIDPIDGTYNFVRGFYPVFGISVAFASGGEVNAGGVLLPLTGDLFMAQRGGGSFRNGHRLQVSDVQQIGEACVDIDFSDLDDRRTFLQRAPEVIRRAGQMRCYGCAVVAMCQIAAGEAEGYLHMSLNPWDYAAAQIIVEEAGGMCTRLDGSPLRLFDRKRGVLITNGAIHREMLALL